MALPVATASAKSLLRKLFFRPSLAQATYRKIASSSKIKCERNHKLKYKQKSDVLVKRRTRSDREFDEETFSKFHGHDGIAHVPVMLGEVLDVFASVQLESFVDCTLGAGGHSAAIIEGHPEMKLYVGLDVDPIAHQIAETQINSVLQKHSTSNLQVLTFLKNFKSIKSVLQDIDSRHARPHEVKGILMDLGMSSMQVNNSERGFSVLNDGPLDMRMNPQATLRAEDILNLWPDAEVGRILRDYGEESNWFSLQKKIVRARLTGGLHSTSELVDLIRSSTSWSRGGRQGWIKTATRVFQALRIAVNDELSTLQDSIHACFDSLACGGRLAIISFHSLEDRIVKQTFLDIVNRNEDARENERIDPEISSSFDMEREPWIKQTVLGRTATVLTKRPITPSESEEKLNPRSRSAKLRVIEKI